MFLLHGPGRRAFVPGRSSGVWGRPQAWARISRVKGPRPTSALAGLLSGLLLCGAVCQAARAAEGLYLTWGDCALGTSAHDQSNACDTNLDGQRLFCAFRMPFAVDSVLGLELVVDLQHSDAAMPAWWMFAPGGCREGYLRPSFDFTNQSSCRDFLLGRGSGGLQDYTVGQPRGGANQARIRIAVAMLPSFGYATLNATDLYYAAELTILNGFTTGTSACDGCADPACLVLNSILVRRQPGAVGGDIYLTAPGPGDANFATWQGGAGANCSTVPVRAMTWGRVKGLYR